MVPVDQVMPEALAEVLRRAPTTPEKVAFAWNVTVGPAVARATSVELHATTLRVQARDVSWQREVERSAGLIKRRLAMLLGDGVVRGIEVRLA